MSTGKKVVDTTHVEVASVARRNVIPTAKRKWGMRCTVTGGPTYVLTQGYVDNNKANNANWKIESTGGGASSGTASEIQKGDGAGGFVGTKIFSTSDGNVQLGDATLAGAQRVETLQGSATDIDKIITPKGAGKIKSASAFVSQGSDYTSFGGKYRIEDSSVPASRFKESYLAAQAQYTANASADVGLYDTSLLPNLTILTLIQTINGIKSDGSEAFTIILKSSWKKVGGVVSRLVPNGDKVIDQDASGLTGTITPSTVLSGTTIQNRLVSAGGAGTFKYSVFVDLSVHSY